MKSMSCRGSGTVVGAGASALFFAFQWIFAILEPSGKGLPFPGNTGLVGRDNLRIPEDRYDQVSGLTDGDDLPVFVSSELREREAARHLHSVLVLRGEGDAAQRGEQQSHDHNHRG